MKQLNFFFKHYYQRINISSGKNQNEDIVFRRGETQIMLLRIHTLIIIGLFNLRHRKVYVWFWRIRNYSYKFHGIPPVRIVILTPTKILGLIKSGMNE